MRVLRLLAEGKNYTEARSLMQDRRGLPMNGSNFHTITFHIREKTGIWTTRDTAACKAALERIEGKGMDDPAF